MYAEKLMSISMHGHKPVLIFWMILILRVEHSSENDKTFALRVGISTGKRMNENHRI